DDTTLAERLHLDEEQVRRKVMDRVRQHSLPMKVSDAEWQWDKKKLTVYFTAEQRVDFRALVRDLASLFHTRIELRQIGARDEAKRLDGVGRCGRQYCCSSWLPELRPVSLSLAKDQHLSLNPSQISGGCGRLLCCLRYEHDFYVQTRKRFPKAGRVVRTALGADRVLAVDIFRETVTPKAWVDRMADTFAGYWRRPGCRHDDWIRTAGPRHARSVTALLERIRQRRPQDLFEAEYEGLYCTGCEEFKAGAQIVDGHCVEHPTLELIPTRERNHFFRLSAYRDTLLERIRSGAL